MEKNDKLLRMWRKEAFFWMKRLSRDKYINKVYPEIFLVPPQNYVASSMEKSRKWLSLQLGLDYKESTIIKLNVDQCIRTVNLVREQIDKIKRDADKDLTPGSSGRIRLSTEDTIGGNSSV